MKKVAIVGAQVLTRENAPYDDSSYEIWSFSDWLCSAWLKRCDALIEIHSANTYMNHPRTPGYWDELRKTETLVYMYPVADPRIENSLLYPKDEVLELLRNGYNLDKPFKPLNSSVAYAIALAIYLGYDVIDVYGVELAHSSEYMSQQPIFAFWVGYALGHGIGMNINCSGGLFNQPLYGFEEEMPTGIIYQMVDEVLKQKADADVIKNKCDGALHVLKALMNTREIYKKENEK